MIWSVGLSGKDTNKFWNNRTFEAKDFGWAGRTTNMANFNWKICNP
jgi:hypothetical protein